jgi:fermentation-respiration switch protein FrsA (DUF1100 family)
LAVCLVIGMLRWFEHSQVYHPGRTMDASGAELGRPCEDVYFKSADGVELHGWHYPAASNSPRADLVMLVCHGNAGNISHRLDLYELLLETGAAIFAFDYRGYGRSGGRPSEEGTYRDALAAYEWLRQKGYAAKRIVLFGESLGGAVAAELCVRAETGGLILQSTFTSIPDIGAELFPWLPVRWINSIKYDTRAKLPRLNVPVLVMHSPTDDLIGFRHGQNNFAAANEPKLFWEIKGGHNDPLADRRQFLLGIESFLRLTSTNTSRSGL